MKNTRIAVASLAMGCVVLSMGAAEARPRQNVYGSTVEAPPLTVTKRSWLDMGKVVPVGTQNSYMSASTVLNQPTYASYVPGKFGQSTLPGQFTLAFSNENPRGPTSGGIFFDELP